MVCWNNTSSARFTVTLDNVWSATRPKGHEDPGQSNFCPEMMFHWQFWMKKASAKYPWILAEKVTTFQSLSWSGWCKVVRFTQMHIAVVTAAEAPLHWILQLCQRRPVSHACCKIYVAHLHIRTTIAPSMCLSVNPRLKSRSTNGSTSVPRPSNSSQLIKTNICWPGFQSPDQQL